MSVSKILASMVLQNYQNLMNMTSKTISIVAFSGGLKCPRKIHLNTQWGKRMMPTKLLLAPMDFQTFLRSCKEHVGTWMSLDIEVIDRAGILINSILAMFWETIIWLFLRTLEDVISDISIMVMPWGSKGWVVQRSLNYSGVLNKRINVQDLIVG